VFSVHFFKQKIVSLKLYDGYYVVTWDKNYSVLTLIDTIATSNEYATLKIAPKADVLRVTAAACSSP
jgi:hypothetical protein